MEHLLPLHEQGCFGTKSQYVEKWATWRWCALSRSFSWFLLLFWFLENKQRCHLQFLITVMTWMLSWRKHANKNKKNIVYLHFSIIKKVRSHRNLGSFNWPQKGKWLPNWGQRINNLHYNSTEAKEDLSALLLIKLKYYIFFISSH